MIDPTQLDPLALPPASVPSPEEQEIQEQNQAEQAGLIPVTGKFLANWGLEVVYGTGLGLAKLSTLHMDLAESVGTYIGDKVVRGLNEGGITDFTEAEMDEWLAEYKANVEKGNPSTYIDMALHDQMERWDSAVGDMRDKIIGDPSDNPEWVSKLTYGALWGTSILPMAYLKAPGFLGKMAARGVSGGGFGVMRAMRQKKVLRHLGQWPGFTADDSTVLRSLMLNRGTVRNLEQAKTEAYDIVARIKTARAAGESDNVIVTLKNELKLAQERVKQTQRVQTELESFAAADDPLVAGAARDMLDQLHKGQLKALPETEGTHLFINKVQRGAKEVEFYSDQANAWIDDIAGQFVGNVQNFALQANRWGRDFVSQLHRPGAVERLGNEGNQALRTKLVGWRDKHHPGIKERWLGETASEDTVEAYTGQNINALSQGATEASADVSRSTRAVADHPQAEFINDSMDQADAVITGWRDDLLELDIEKATELERVRFDEINAARQTLSGQALKDAEDVFKARFDKRIKDAKKAAKKADEKEKAAIKSSDEVTDKSNYVEVEETKVITEEVEVPDLAAIKNDEVIQSIEADVRGMEGAHAAGVLPEAALSEELARLENLRAERLTELGNPTTFHTQSRIVKEKVMVRKDKLPSKKAKEYEAVDSEGKLILEAQWRKGMITDEEYITLAANRRYTEAKAKFQAKLAETPDEVPLLDKLKYMDNPRDIAAEFVRDSWRRYHEAKANRKTVFPSGVPNPITTFHGLMESIVRIAGPTRALKTAVRQAVEDGFVGTSGQPMWVKSLDEVPQNLRGDFVQLDGSKGSKGRLFKTEIAGKGPLFVHRDILNRLQLAFSDPHDLMTWEKIVGQLKRGHFLFSLFHSMTLVESNVSGLGLGKGLHHAAKQRLGIPYLSKEGAGSFIPGLQSNPMAQADPAQGTRVLKSMLDETFEMDSAVLDASVAGLKLDASNLDAMRLDAENPLLRWAAEARADIKAGRAKDLKHYGYRILDNLNWVQQNFEYSLWDRLHFHSKLLYYRSVSDHLLDIKRGVKAPGLFDKVKLPFINNRVYKQLERMNEVEIKQYAARAANDEFGGQLWELAKKGIMQQLANPRNLSRLRLAFESPDWNISSVRQHAAFLQSVPGHKASDAVRGYIGLRHTMNYFIGHQVAGNALNLAFSQKLMKDNPSGYKGSVDMGPMFRDPDTGEHHFFRMSKSLHDGWPVVFGLWEGTDYNPFKLMSEGADPIHVVGTHLGGKMNASIRGLFIRSLATERYLKALNNEAVGMGLPEFTIVSMMDAAKGFLPFMLGESIEGNPLASKGSMMKLLQGLVFSAVPYPIKGAPSNDNIVMKLSAAYRKGDMARVETLKMGYLQSGKQWIDTKDYRTGEIIARGLLSLDREARSKAINDMKNPVDLGGRLLSAATQNADHLRPDRR